MAIFFDDFERANGAPGGNWVTVVGTPTISGGNLQGAATWLAYNSSIQENGRHEASVHVFYGAASSNYAHVAVKMTGSANQGYSCHLADVTSTPAFVLRGQANASGTILATTTLASKPGPYVKYTLVWDQGHLSAYLNDELLLEADDSAWAAGQYMGCGGTSAAAQVADFRCIGGGALDLNISPDIIGAFGLQWSLTAAGLGTSWSTGTPGSPAFSCDHGTIDSQTISDATTATLLYSPGEYLGPVTFTDPSTGETDTIMVSSNPVYLPDIPGQLSEAAVAWLEAQAEHGGLVVQELNGSEDITEGFYAKGAFGELLAGKRVTVGPGAPSIPDPAVLYQLWRLLNGQYPSVEGPFPTPGYPTIDAGLVAIMASLNAISGNGVDTLDSILNLLGGDPFASHQTILTEIRGMPGADYSSIIDAIHELRGAEGSTVEGAIELIQAISTIAGYDLADVASWIDDVRGAGSPTLATVMAKLYQIQSGSMPDLLTIDQHISTMAAVVSAIELVTGGIAEGVTELLNRPSPTALAGPPVWPGLAGVTLGTPAALVDGLTLTGPMHGVLVDITGHPVSAGQYHFGDKISWTHVGAVCFVTDRGDYERPDALGLEDHIVTPRTMTEAASCVFRLNNGFTGTARSWSRNG